MATDRVINAMAKVVEEEKWMESCGGTREGYRNRYGTGENAYGDGADAIYEADLEALNKARRELRDAIDAAQLSGSRI